MGGLSIFKGEILGTRSGALRYALRIGLLALENPELTIEEIKDIIEAQVDYEMGRIAELNPKDI